MKGNKWKKMSYCVASVVAFFDIIKCIFLLSTSLLKYSNINFWKAGNSAWIDKYVYTWIP